MIVIPDSKVHGVNMGPTWVLSAPDGPHVGRMNIALRDVMLLLCYKNEMILVDVYQLNVNSWLSGRLASVPRLLFRV